MNAELQSAVNHAKPYGSLLKLLSLIHYHMPD